MSAGLPSGTGSLFAALEMAPIPRLIAANRLDVFSAYLYFILWLFLSGFPGLLDGSVATIMQFAILKSSARGNTVRADLFFLQYIIFRVRVYR
jgi:hypothetical protein